MPPRKSDSSRKNDASASASAAVAASASASTARFAPIEDDLPTAAPQPPPPPPPPPRSLAMPASRPSPGGPGAGLSASPALALPSMDPTSMPPPSLPPPGAPAQTNPDAVAAFASRPGSAAASVPSGRGGSAPSQTTPSEKGKEKEEGGKTGPGGHPKEAITIPIEELQLPKSIITRLAKGVLPPNTQIQANAILAMTKSATVFINHLANAANEVTALQSKKTIMPADVFRALDDIEYGFMRERVEAEFAKFNETQTTKRSAYRKKVAVSRKTSKGSGDGADTTMAETDGDTTMGAADTTANSAGSTTGPGQPRAKKARTNGSEEGMDVDDEEQDASDPESVPNEDDDEEEEEQQEEEEEDGGDDQEGAGDEVDQDELEERENRVDDDEALDDGNHSD